MSAPRPPRSAAEAIAHLVATSDNPIPPGALVRCLRTPDGTAVRAARWEAQAAWPTGTVAIIQGQAECIEKYYEVIGELLERGFAVAIFDWRGQGGSARELADTRIGHIDDFSLYRADLQAFIDEIIRPFCPKPWFALAHSMGGALLAAAAHDGVVPFERAVLDAPMLKINIGQPEAVVKAAARGLDALGFGGMLLPGWRPALNFPHPFEGNKLTSDPVRFARTEGVKVAAPYLAIGGPTIGWLNAALRFCEVFADPDYARETRMPCLVLATGNDQIVDSGTIERYATNLKAGSHILIPHARHEILIERDEFREQFWAAFDAFIPGTRAELQERGPRAQAGGSAR
jgi:lysophospholipase